NAGDAQRPPRRDLARRVTIADVQPAPARALNDKRPVASRPATMADVARAVDPPARQSLGAAPAPLDLARVAGRWDALVAQVRSDGKRVLASTLEHALPVAATAAGDLTIELDEPNEFLSPAVESGQSDIAATLR